jgi:signal transduction histidine kinase
VQPVNPSRGPESARELPTSRRRFSAVLSLVRAIASAPSVTDAARKAFASLGELEGWTTGVLWLVPEAGGRLQMAEIWNAPGSSITPGGLFARGEGLAGRAWAAGRPLFVGDLSGDEELRRDPWIEREGMRAANAVPILAGGRAFGVMELFGRSPRTADAFAEELWSAVADELGRLVERAALERAAARAEQRLRLVLAQAPVVLFAFDREGHITLGEGRALADVPLTPGRGNASIFALYRDAPVMVTQARRALAGEADVVVSEVTFGDRVRAYETRMEPLFDAEGRVVEVIGVATDVTERREAEAALLRSEASLVEAGRLASLGTLAAGVAHEINNPLAYVLLNLELMIREASQGRSPEGSSAEGEADLLPRMHEALAGVERVRAIVQDLKSFSRPASSDRRGPVDVRRVLDTTIDIAANEIRHRARLVRLYDEVSPVAGDGSRLGQVFLNLLINAAQAIPEGDASRNEVKVATRMDDAGRIVVEIADTGAGIPKEHLERVFEPFFTTKPAGVGTGIGLSICRSIVAALGGEIGVESALGHGTVFRVVLPAAPVSARSRELDDRRAPAETGFPSSRSPGSGRERRGGRVLVVDDEPALGAALARSLERDFEPVVVTSGREALERLRVDQAFDVILCDLIMPQLTGMDLHDELHRMAPPLAERIVFMTGGTFTARAQEFLQRVANPVLEKPFDLPTLNALVRARARK